MSFLLAALLPVPPSNPLFPITRRRSVVGQVDWLARGELEFFPLAITEIGIDATVEQKYRASAKTAEKQQE
jgi:hypothetical protein